MAKEKELTALAVYNLLSKIIDEGHGDEKFKVSVPFRDGVGLHYEDVVNITVHEGMVDMHTTVPDHDDIDRPASL